MKLVVRLLTEMLEVRILPGEPIPLVINHLNESLKVLSALSMLQVRCGVVANFFLVNELLRE